MSITIKQREKEWRIELDNEEWKAEDRNQVDKILKELLDLKETYGKVKEVEK